ncbi:hypothetical protein Vretimale_19272 [Volvox reticuliferus]|uniref:WW domain-containing protein n=1 Tax=Volvox reticuliferus TaxID=1737510 RepID=A0A8J4D1I5_9CHLO|nr:hypothetical protein Vretifemale_17594 [Volvox reticuliferus]GIM16654.1 hypothetical protein Vretimale_19272 [Volvox reticuliferus]
MAGSRRLLSLCFVAALVFAVTAKVNVKLTDKLVELLRKKQLDGIVEELQRDGMDVNQPDSKGKLPLVEAVRTKELKFVDAMLQYGALAKSKDPATGATPLHVAFQQNVPQVAKLLLQYGADVNAEDKSGKKARDYAPSKEIRELIASYDNNGAMAFEDPPGTWTKQDKGAKDEYWFNGKTGESRWNVPPSCAWQRVDVQGHPIKYINAITGQEVTKVPPSLAWVKVRSNNQEMYYNFIANISQVEVPQEVPKDMLAEIEKNVNARWHNEKTGEFSWTDPTYNSVWRELVDEETGNPYWFNIETGDSVWDMPADMEWTKVPDEETGQFYFHNRATMESTWDAPSHLAWVRHDSDL